VIVKTCVNCETPISAGVECPRCNAISSVFCLVATRYNGREMKQLADNLADCDLVEFIKDAKFNGAPTAVYIANMIERMAFAANIDKDSLRLSVVRRIREHIKEIGSVFQQEREEGCQGEYKRKIIETIESWVKTLQAKK
jgi:hypothetical protein